MGEWEVRLVASGSVTVHVNAEDQDSAIDAAMARAWLRADDSMMEWEPDYAVALDDAPGSPGSTQDAEVRP